MAAATLSGTLGSSARTGSVAKEIAPSSAKRSAIEAMSFRRSGETPTQNAELPADLRKCAGKDKPGIAPPQRIRPLPRQAVRLQPRTIDSVASILEPNLEDLELELAGRD